MKIFQSNKWLHLTSVILCLAIVAGLLSGCGRLGEDSLNESAPPAEHEMVTVSAKSETSDSKTISQSSLKEDKDTFDLSDVPAFSGDAYVEVHDNIPYFLGTDLTSSSYEKYSELDSLGRCGIAQACIGRDLMPTVERGKIGMVKPTGWHLVKYDFVDGKYLYNRCHLIGYQLAGENANTKNLITGTRYLNTEGMLPFENMVADYVKETENHVLYRVTPIFEGDNLLATGVLMEGKSVEDNGEGILFCVFCYNTQPGVTIDYATGDSRLSETTTTPPLTPVSTSIPAPTSTPAAGDYSGYTYILNTRSKKVHFPSCPSVDDMKESNKLGSNESPEELIRQGYKPCGNCQPFAMPTTSNTP